MKYHIYHHNDADGHASGAVTAHALHFLDGIPLEDITFYRINYGQPFDDSKINYKKDIVYMVDFALQPYERMRQLIEKLGDRFIWIDHHKTSSDFIEEQEDFPFVGIVKEGDKAACMLAWEWFHGPASIPPYIIELTSQYDIWDKEGKYDWEEVLCMQIGMRNIETRPAESMSWWVDVIEDDSIAGDLHKEGRLLKAFNDKRQEQLVKGHAYEADFCGYHAIVMNTAEGGSHQFEAAFDVSEYDMMVAYRMYKGEYWVLNLYSTNPKVDCGALAKKLGAEGPFKSGGGHPGAAGFQTDIEHLQKLLNL